jgi:hypothetical protein
LANNHLWKSSCYHHLCLIGCDSCVWSFLSPSTALYLVFDWRKCCSVDYGVSPFWHLNFTTYMMERMTNIVFDCKRWMAELISDNAEQRAFTAAAMNTLQCKLPSHTALTIDRRLTARNKIHSQHGFHLFGFSKLINPMVRVPCLTFRIRQC